MISAKNKSAVSRVRNSLGKFASIPYSSLPPDGGSVSHTVKIDGPCLRAVLMIEPRLLPAIQGAERCEIWRPDFELVRPVRQQTFRDTIKARHRLTGHAQESELQRTGEAMSIAVSSANRVPILSREGEEVLNLEVGQLGRQPT